MGLVAFTLPLPIPLVLARFSTDESAHSAYEDREVVADGFRNSSSRDPSGRSGTGSWETWIERSCKPRSTICSPGRAMSVLGPFALAFVAGIVSFTSPCCLPLMPGHGS
jgi:hypothetical protein